MKWFLSLLRTGDTQYYEGGVNFEPTSDRGEMDPPVNLLKMDQHQRHQFDPPIITFTKFGPKSTTLSLTPLPSHLQQTINLLKEVSIVYQNYLFNFLYNCTSVSTPVTQS